LITSGTSRVLLSVAASGAAICPLERRDIVLHQGWPKSVKSTIFTEPGGPLGDSLSSGVTRSTRESGKIEA
jgi:hypothetical protein